jgi:hypothetical protein
MNTTKPWSVLAYTVADDKGSSHSLDTSARHELKALCDAADFGQVSVAAQVDFVRPRGVFRGAMTAPPPKSRDFEPVRAENHPLWRKILGDVERSTLEVFKEQEDLNAAHGGVLQDFLRFGRDKCPADRYVVFFYGHAYGPMGLFYDKDAGGRVANTLRLNDLADAVSHTGDRAAVVVFRDCFMNTLECAFQMRGAAEFMIATQALAPIAGVWPWLNFMASLTPGAASGDVGRAIAMQLGHFLDQPVNREPFADVPYALLDLDVTIDLVEPMRALVAALESVRNSPKRRAAAAAALEGARMGFPDDAKRPGDPALLDVPTMCDRLQQLKRHPAAAPARALGEVVRDRLIRWHHSQQGTFQGTSLYYQPVTAEDRERSYVQSADEQEAVNDAAYYATLALCQQTGWHRIALNPLAL